MRASWALALAAVVCVAGASPVYYDSTRQYSHSNDNGDAVPGTRNVGDPATRGFKNPAQSLNKHTSAESQRSASGGTLVQSITTAGLDGWTAVTMVNTPATVTATADTGTGVVGADTSSESWFFLGPTDRFAGNLAAAYNGKLMLSLIHSETPSDGHVMRAPDVILEATCGHSLYLYDFATKGGDLSVMLNEDAGWIDSRTKAAPGALDFLGVLSHLASIKIRGGYYSGSESTRLSSVTITAGKAWHPCCTIDGTVDICQKKPSSYYNPEGLTFYCEGHMYRPVKVNRVVPRFGRRTGGSTITVIGENFGLAGSQPTVRINGRRCERTMFASGVVRDETNADQALPGTAGAANAVPLSGTGDTLSLPNNAAGNALINAYNSATDSMKQQFPEHCWNGMKDDGTATGYNYGTAATPKYINQGESGIDVGGPCFPAHCASCPVASLDSATLNNLGAQYGSGSAFLRCDSANQIAAETSHATGCKGRGDDNVLCNFQFPYLKFPHFCPDDASFTSTLRMANTQKYDYLDLRQGSAAGAAAFQTSKYNTQGIFTKLNTKNEMQGYKTTVTKVNPDFDTSASTGVLTKAVTIEVDDAVALCGLEFFQLHQTAGTDMTMSPAVSMTETAIVMSAAVDDQVGQYFHPATTFVAAALGLVAGDNVAYIMIDEEIMTVTAVAGTAITVVRGAFGTPITAHADTAVVRAVEVCRKQTVRVSPANSEKQTSTGGMYLGITKNAVCHAYTGQTALDGRQCTLEVASDAQLVRGINLGDIVRRTSTGRTKVLTDFNSGATAIVVTSAAHLMGTDGAGWITVGGLNNVEVTAVNFVTNTLTVTTGTVTALGVAGSIVTRLDTTTAANAVAISTDTQFTATFDVASATHLLTSDVGEFGMYRYLKMGNEIVRIIGLADNADGVPANGYERITVARAQMGTHAEPHKTGVTVELIPRRTELAAAVDGGALATSTLFFPTAIDITSNAIGSSISRSGLQSGNTIFAAFIKIDQEIVKVLSTTVDATGVFSATVMRGQKGTLAVPHAAGAPVIILSCMDADETGNNCGGSCKPCPSAVAGGPKEQEKLICITPAGESGFPTETQGSGDLAVTVEAAPGPRESPFAVRMKADMTGWEDKSTNAISCISEQNRGFQYGAHDFVWGIHFKAEDDAADVKVTDMAVDGSTGETYMVGTFADAMTVQGKHIAMNAAMGGRLRIAAAAVSYIDSVLSALTTTTGTSGAAPADADGEFVGKTVKVIATTGIINLDTGCTGVVSAYVAATLELTFSALTRANDAPCVGTTAATTLRIYNGRTSFIAKFSKDGRPVWLNKIDTAAAGQEAVITSIAIDTTNAKHYIAGYFSDGLTKHANVAKATLNIYSIDEATRVAAAVAIATVSTQGIDSYGQVSVATAEGVHYQEGFIIKYTNAGVYEANEAVKGKAILQQLVISNLKIRAFHPSTSAAWNSQTQTDARPQTQRTAKSRTDVEWDRGMFTASGTLGGGTVPTSTAKLATSAAQFLQGSGQTLTTAGAAANNWYNGLTITITCGKGIGQSRRIQDYDAATRTVHVQPHWNSLDTVPDETSCYMITGKPSSLITGHHYQSGGIYLTGHALNKVATGAATMCFGEMPTSFRDVGAGVGIPVCAAFKSDLEDFNFLAQYDKDLKAYWVRMMYDSDVTLHESGTITGITTMNDMVYVVGSYGTNAAATGAVTMRLQNCTFDSANVLEGPPENTAPIVTTYKKLCRTQDISLTDVGLLEVQTANSQITGETKTLVGVQGSGTPDYDVQGTIASDYVELPAVVTGPAIGRMYVAAYDGSGMLVWYHFVDAVSTDTAFSIAATAITHVIPAIGNKPLTGYWKSLSDGEMLWKSRGQPRDSSAAKDVSSERVDSATVRGGFLYIVGTISTGTADHRADFGVTKYPLECSNGKTVGAKAGQVTKPHDAQCAGQLQALGTTATKDIFLAKYSAKGSARTDYTMTTYGSGTQPEVQYVRRTGLAGKDDTASSVAVHDLTGAIYVTGTYLSSSASKYQGSDIGESKYLATTGNDGGNTYSASRTSGISLNSGDDVFGLSTAGRVNSIGCPRQRAAPLDQHEERLGLTGLPDCTMYSHAASDAKPTGFIVKFNDNGDQTTRGNKNRVKYASITGTATADSSVSPCAGTAETDGAQHVLTQPSACSTHPSGCSCVTYSVSSVTSGVVDADANAVGLLHKWNGMKIKIVSGKGAGYEGIISVYSAAAFQFNVIPALPTSLDETSHFTLNPWAELGQRIHKADCTGVQDQGCQAYAVEWAKSIGWPIAQTKVAQTAYGSPSDVRTEDPGAWTTSPGTNTATELYLAVADAVETTTFYDNYLVELAGSVSHPFGPITLATISAYTASDAYANGGFLTIACPDNTAAACPALTATWKYRLRKIKNAATGVAETASMGALAQSSPQMVTMVDGDVYVGGWFKGFEDFRFGIEGVDEVMGYKSVGPDTWESYMVKLQD
mmetsp:Transcript_4235/g.10192  ORF Transcript_4235/g.10192 Transcript_4235/m.10192 type:complete len:2463 (-) Transcript_4235:343-7731(-)